MMQKSFLYYGVFSLLFAFPSFADRYTTNIPSVYDNGEYVSNGKALTAIGADKAYTERGAAYSGFSGAGISVAVIDDGTMTSHSDLVGQISSLQQSEFNQSLSQNATQVAGIIAGAKNGDGMHGVAYNAKLLNFSSLPATAWQTLLSSDYDSVKIINNNGWTRLDDLQKYELNQLADKMVKKDKLIIAPAGDDMRRQSNSFLVDMVNTNSALANNVINVVSYDSTKALESSGFLSSFSNVAGNAKKWTLAAPGTGINSTILYDSQTSPKYGTISSTSAAAAMVSGAAALVQEAFPYLNSKQIADVLFSTAFKKDVVGERYVMNYYLMQQDSENGNSNIYIITDMLPSITIEEAKNHIRNDTGYDCNGGALSLSCYEVTFEEVFGQGLLDVGSAVKGMKYFDANRLMPEDFDTAFNQYFYSVDTNGYDSTWSNTIGQVKSETAHTDADIGLKKQGEGTLSLTNANTFKGTTLIEGGELKLTSSGALLGDVLANAGKFSFFGELNGNLTIKEPAKFDFIQGTLNGDVENKGTARAIKGTTNGNITNNGKFYILGTEDIAGMIAGDFSVASGKKLTNKNLLYFGEKGVFSGDLQNEGTIFVAGESKLASGNITNGGNIVLGSGVVFEGNIDNKALVLGAGKIVGTVDNQTNGFVASSLMIDTLKNNAGNILITTSNNGTQLATMQVNTLDISGGNFVLADNNIAFDEGQNYTLIKYNTLNRFENFTPEITFSDFIKANVQNNVANKSIDATVVFSPLSTALATNFYSDDEKTVAGIMDKMYFDGDVTEFKKYYHMSALGVQREINLMRYKAKPINKELLPLANVMTSQIFAHLFNFDVAKAKQGRATTPRTEVKSRLWGQVLGGRVEEDIDDDLAKGDVKAKHSGGMIGYDYEFSPNMLVGFAAGVSKGKLTQDSDKDNVWDYRAGIYTSSKFNRLTLNSVLMGGFQQYKRHKYMEFAGANNNLSRADFDGYLAEFDLSMGYDVYQGDLCYLRPYIAGNISYISQEAYQEKGNSTSLLGVDKVDNTSTGIISGIALSYAFSKAVLTADFSYERVLSGDSMQASAYFLADGTKTKFDSLEVGTDKNYFNAGLGIDTEIYRNTWLNLWAGTRISDNTNAMNFTASV